MLRDFCLNCGSPLPFLAALATRQRAHPCVCTASSELLHLLERQEQAHLPQYVQARPLSETDLERLVLCDGRPLTVAQMIGVGYAANAIRALVPRVADRELVQLVYIKRVGSVLFTWPFCESGLAGPHRPERLRIKAEGQAARGEE